jgi:hypothetical protein
MTITYFVYTHSDIRDESYYQAIQKHGPLHLLQYIPLDNPPFHLITAMNFIIYMAPLRIQSASGIHLPMQSEYPYHPLKHMEPLWIQSASGIHLPMQSGYPYHPL